MSCAVPESPARELSSELPIRGKLAGFSVLLATKPGILHMLT